MLATKIENGKFWCGFCSDEDGNALITQKIVKQSKGNGKHSVTDQVVCRKCGNYIPQKNLIN